MKNISKVVLSSIILLSGLGCSDNNTQEQSVVSNNNTVNEIVKTRLVTQSIKGSNEEYTIENDFFIAPLTYYATLGNVKYETQSEINNDGHNYIVVPNIFDTYFETMKLNFTYNSEDSRDDFNNIFGQWRTSFTSYIDFGVDYDNANIKSNLYNTPTDACQQGFEDIKGNLYRGLLSDSYVAYDDLKNICVVNGSNGKVGEFNIFSKTYGIVGDYHYISKPSGQTLVFSKKDETHYISNDRGLEVTLELKDDTYEYIDSDSVKYTYNNDKKLIKITKEGQTTEINYDDRYKVSSVNGPKDTSMLYNYDENERLTSVVFDKKILQCFITMMRTKD